MMARATAVVRNEGTRLTLLVVEDVSADDEIRRLPQQRALRKERRRVSRRPGGRMDSQAHRRELAPRQRSHVHTTLQRIQPARSQRRAQPPCKSATKSTAAASLANGAAVVEHARQLLAVAQRDVRTELGGQKTRKRRATPELRSPEMNHSDFYADCNNRTSRMRLPANWPRFA